MIGLEQPRIACCLSGGDYQRRVAWIERLTSEALRSSARDDLVLSTRRRPTEKSKRW
jgi:hypothetical protein